MLMNFYLINHFRELWPALEPLGLEAWLNAKDFSLLIRHGRQSMSLLPQFTIENNGKLEYTPKLSEKVVGFIGWRPYFNRRWPLSTDKLAFKRYVAERNLRTPPYSQDPEVSMK